MFSSIHVSSEIRRPVLRLVLHVGFSMGGSEVSYNGVGLRVVFNGSEQNLVLVHDNGSTLRTT